MEARSERPQCWRSGGAPGGNGTGGLKDATFYLDVGAALVVDLVADDVLLHGEAERTPATDLEVVKQATRRGIERDLGDDHAEEVEHPSAKRPRNKLRPIVEHGEIPLFGSGFDFRRHKYFTL
ncbi:hypothetical protein E2562_013205 [Oryza meyeriana var. granulata]|uniref:Uncharacterized protein n=1 Tax=Oryza meyeriana var. granulata TaxID=110450 RepID=A0A6G1DKJ5_9ORYZ|nr:hypothetical protein E2562_013205 [Oryza meyeriana var. granulata]